MEWAPHTTVAAIIERDSRFLMVEEYTRQAKLLVLNQPAGHLEDGETILDALKREVLEETCWQVEPQHLVGVYKWQVPETGATYLRFCIAAKALEKVVNCIRDPAIHDTHWVTLDELKSASDRHRSPMVLQCLDDYLAGQAWPLEMIHEIPTD